MLSTRLALLELARQRRLSASAYEELRHIASLRESVHLPEATVRQRVRILAAALAGLGLIFFLAANWEAQNPFAMFLLLETLLAAACYGAARFVRFRVGLALFGLLTIGTMFGFFGQHYQSGADPWQLFALWTALALPLALASRSDLVWSVWVVVAMCGVSTWLAAHGGRSWFGPTGLHIQLTAMLAALAIPLALSAPWRTWSGAGIWAQNLALLSAAGLATTLGVTSLFDSNSPMFWLALLALCQLFTFFTSRAAFDTLSLSITALAIDVLLVCGAVRLGLEFRSFGALLVLVGLTAVAALMSSAMLIIHLYRKQSREGQDRDQSN
ncbi:DUF2157 domain-containing protein [Massilia sp. MS-15]|uniref:DUF2157 domain-containing protein n=1 Tax=Massilia sp. MS-15 TaxID=2878200 RepID=UPI001CD22369|nr:DUF2157 domain-containing protein [Massilia sp. MS-15]MCA1248866.1 DUF2157 domain-containing protein [Massilia sp. MS-15]